jgi:hypothetical protein
MIEREGVDIQTQGGPLECFEIQNGQHFPFFPVKIYKNQQAIACWKLMQNT